MENYLNQLATITRTFLAANLQLDHPDYWQRNVVDRLTYSQKAHLLELGASADIDSLDLAALLRVLDQHWLELKHSGKVSYEGRNYLKEAQAIRNRYAHRSAGETPVQDLYRDLDTVQRLATELGASSDFLEELAQRRDDIMHPPLDASSSQKATRLIPPGSRVQLIADPSIIGVVTKVVDDLNETRLEVFGGDGRTRTLYVTQVELIPDQEEAPKVRSDDLRAMLTATQLAHPSSRFLYSLFSSRINFVPYQFRPVMKLIHADRPRLLIADEVGVGKTIEAGLIIKELQARKEISSILVICPKALVTERKWAEELKRFDESFEHLDGPALRRCIDETDADGKWPSRYSRVIIPFSLLDERMFMGTDKGRTHEVGLVDLDHPPKFDLVIVDEAHHVRHADTWRHRNVEFIVNNAEAVVFLTATPIQTHSDDLFTLLRLLRPDVVANRQDFARIGQPNSYLNAAAAAARKAEPKWQGVVAKEIQQAVNTPWGAGVLAADPRLQEISDLLEVQGEGKEEARIRLIRLLEELHTFSGLINRTRRRDIGNFTTRKPEAPSIPMSSPQQLVHDATLELCAQIVAERHGERSVSFLISGLRRQVASSVNGLAPMLRDLVNRRLDSLVEALDDQDDIGLDVEALDPYRLKVDELVALAESIGDDDPKFEEMLKILSGKRDLVNPKVLVFTSFRHTLFYLYERLTREGLKVAMVHGNLPDDQRRDQRRRFKLSPKEVGSYDILLSTEVGTEGLDYQFCDTLINYDLPWNPMRIEQRIGRIDRYGQQSETVAIINLITPGTVDADIYERCLTRIGIFEQALGASEAILGEITSGISSIANNLTLTDKERSSQLQQLADNQINIIQEQQRLEQQQSELFGLDVPPNDDRLVQDATSPWLTPNAVAHLVVTYLETIDPGKRLNLQGGRVATLRMSRDHKNILLADLQKLGNKVGSDLDWNKWLKSDAQTCLITSSTEQADERRDVILLSPTHPLVRSAAASLKISRTVETALAASTHLLPPGRYPFAVHGWNRLGIRDDYELHVTAATTSIAEAIMRLLQEAETDLAISSISNLECESIDSAHYGAWADARAAQQDQVLLVANARLASLNTTARAHAQLVEEQLAVSLNPKIRRMRESQLANLEGDFERRRNSLENSAKRGDITSDPLVVGIVTVTA